MSRNRDLANILSSSGSVALDSEMGLTLITPTSISVTSGSGSISNNGSVSFTGATNISLNGVFSSSFINYFVVIDYKGSVSNFATLRLKTGSDDSSSNYYWQRIVANSTTVSGSSQSSQTSFDIGRYLDNTTGRFLNIFRPNIADRTGYESHGSTWEYLVNYGGLLDTTTQYTGFTIFASSGTLSGTISVYGYRN